MNDRQRRAYENPATYADEVPIDSRRIVAFRGSQWSTLLSVNK